MIILGILTQIELNLRAKVHKNSHIRKRKGKKSKIFAYVNFLLYFCSRKSFEQA